MKHIASMHGILISTIYPAGRAGGSAEKYSFVLHRNYIGIRPEAENENLSFN